MSGLSVRDGFSVARSQTRDRVENAMDLNKLFRVIDADPAIVGAGVVFIDSDFNVVTLREFQPICSVAVKRVVLREAPRYMGAQEFVRALESSSRESEMVKESIVTGVACAGAVLSWIVVISGSALVPFSMGSSGVLTALGWSAAIAGSGQCMVGVTRVMFESTTPLTNDVLDSSEWYQAVMSILDAISVAGGSVSIIGTQVLKKALLKTTDKSIRQALSGLSRQERYQLTSELLSLKYPSLSAKMIQLQRVSKKLPKRFTPAEVSNGLRTQIKDLIAGRLAIGGSALSGNIHAIGVAIYEEIIQQ
jgi:hypothetical protein